MHQGGVGTDAPGAGRRRRGHEHHRLGVHRRLSMSPQTLARFSSPRFSAAWLLGADHLPEHIAADNTALIWDDGERTYRELRERALSLGAALRGLGLEPGDRVMVHLLNRGETFELYFACAFAGLTLVPVNWRLTPRELAMIVDDCQPRIIFTQEHVADSVSEVGAERAIPVVVLDDHGSGDDFERLA